MRSSSVAMPHHPLKARSQGPAHPPPQQPHKGRPGLGRGRRGGDAQAARGCTDAHARVSGWPTEAAPRGAPEGSPGHRAGGGAFVPHVEPAGPPERHTPRPTPRGATTCGPARRAPGPRPRAAALGSAAGSRSPASGGHPRHDRTHPAMRTYARPSTHKAPSPRFGPRTPRRAPPPHGPEEPSYSPP